MRQKCLENARLSCRQEEGKNEAEIEKIRNIRMVRSYIETHRRELEDLSGEE